MMNFQESLFVICCSNHKELTGKGHYIKNSVSTAIPGLKESLLKRRYEVFKLLMRDDTLTRSGIPLCDLPYNKNLQYGPDFGGKTPGSYLPAYQRYKGRLYREIKKRTWLNLNNNVIIVSGLYGILSPIENIQLYSLDINDSPQILDLWEKGDFLTNYLINFLKAKHFKRVINLIADPNYLKLINWDRISADIPVLHAIGEQNFIGPALLPSLGSFLQIYSSKKHKYFNFFYGKDWIRSRYERIRLTAENPYNCMESSPVSLLSNAIRFNQESQTKKVDDSEYKEIQEILEHIPHSERILHMTPDAIRGALDLPQNILVKFMRKIGFIIKNDDYTSLELKMIQGQKKKIYRCRIDDYWRMHMSIEGKRVNILAVGPHKIKGIG